MGHSALVEQLRPQDLSEFCGQPQVVEQLRVVMTAARDRDELPGHVLLYGGPGLGKTTLATIIANTLGTRLLTVHAPAVERPADLAQILSAAPDHGAVLFIDEIHALDQAAEELLYPAMEDGVLDMVVPSGSSTRSLRVPLPPLVFVGATTRADKLSAPLRDRFRLSARLSPYPAEEIVKILHRSAGVLDVDLTDDGAEVLAQRSNGNPRRANQLLALTRDWAQLHAGGTVSGDAVREAMRVFDVDELGLDQLAHAVLDHLAHAGRPVGLSALATAVGESAQTVETIVEPQLIQHGLVTRGPRGRELTRKGWEHVDASPREEQLHLA